MRRQPALSCRPSSSVPASYTRWSFPPATKKAAWNMPGWRVTIPPPCREKGSCRIHTQTYLPPREGRLHRPSRLSRQKKYPAAFRRTPQRGSMWTGQACRLKMRMSPAGSSFPPRASATPSCREKRMKHTCTGISRGRTCLRAASFWIQPAPQTFAITIPSSTATTCVTGPCSRGFGTCRMKRSLLPAGISGSFSRGVPACMRSLPSGPLLPARIHIWSGSPVPGRTGHGRRACVYFLSTLTERT